MIFAYSYPAMMMSVFLSSFEAMISSSHVFGVSVHRSMNRRARFLKTSLAMSSRRSLMLWMPISRRSCFFACISIRNVGVLSFSFFDLS